MWADADISFMLQVKEIYVLMYNQKCTEYKGPPIEKIIYQQQQRQKMRLYDTI